MTQSMLITLTATLALAGTLFPAQAAPAKRQLNLSSAADNASNLVSPAHTSAPTNGVSPASAPSLSPNPEAPSPDLAPGQDTSSNDFILYNADVVHYPFTIHLPDRTTRNLPPLPSKTPLVISLSGSGARGDASEAVKLSGYDGISRKTAEYNAGQRTPPHCQAAEEAITVVPIAPVESSQEDARWDLDIIANIISQVTTMYDVDPTRIYLSSYSMGAGASWQLLMAYPQIFAGSVISSNPAYGSAKDMERLLGNSIRTYYGEKDHEGTEARAKQAQSNWDTAQQSFLARNGTSSVYANRTMETIGPIPGATHGDMTERPWDADVITDGYAGATSWLFDQRRLEGAVIPAYNTSLCTSCIPSV